MAAYLKLIYVIVHHTIKTKKELFAISIDLYTHCIAKVEITGHQVTSIECYNNLKTTVTSNKFQSKRRYQGFLFVEHIVLTTK